VPSHPELAEDAEAALGAANLAATAITITNAVTLRTSFDLLRFFTSIPPYLECGVTLIRNERKTSK
jgi:hypothetical protein